MIKSLKKYKFSVIFIFLIPYLLLLPSLGRNIFCDEYDVMTGSWLVSKGYIIYKDFFEHHMPFPYYIMSIFNIIGLNFPIGLRLGYTLIILFFWILLYNISKDKLGKKTIFSFMLIHAITLHYYWGNMMLADSFFGFASTIILAIIIQNEDLIFNIKEKIIIGIMTFIAFTSTVISIYPLMLFYLYYIINRIYIYYIDIKNAKYEFKKDINFMIIVLSPFIIWILSMVICNNFNSFIRDAIQFNTKYYSRFTGEDTPLTLITNYIKNIPKIIYEGIFNGYPLFSYDYIFNGVVTIIPIIFTIIWYSKNNYKCSILSYLFLILLRMREPGFHSIPYYLPSFLLISIVIKEAISYLKLNIEKYQLNIKETVKQYSFSILVIIISIWEYESIKLYGKTLFPLRNEIIDPFISSQVEVMKQILTKNDMIWAAPIFPEIYFFTKCEPANRNIFYLPWQSVVPGTNEKIIKDLNKNNPKVIYMLRSMDIWGYPLEEYGYDVLQYISDNYFIVNDYSNLYFNKQFKEAILNILLDKQYVELFIDNKKIINYTNINSNIKKQVDNVILNKDKNISNITIINETNIGNIINRSIKQKFKANNNIITGVQILLATYGHQEYGELLISIEDNKGHSKEISRINLKDLLDNKWLNIILSEPLQVVQNNDYILHIQATSPDKNSAITIYSSINDYYPEGTLSIDSQIQPGDLCFKIIGE